MKKLIIGSLMVISMNLLNADANAQGVAFHRMSTTAPNPHPEANTRIVDEMDVNIHAVRDFKKSFRQATDAKWVKNENGASVYFVNDGVKMRTSYNLKGRKEYMLKYYDESRMTPELRKRVRSHYYDHSIVIVTEVTRFNQTYYLVKMENEKEYLTVRVSDGEMSEFEKVNKLQ